ncbi:MAG: YesL family protein [Oscillospiraceae bacterium]|nr:YesL family protein [Oscillospiraceae bacterium]
MGGIFSYDSKLMQMLDTLGNTIMLTALFILCCIPIITIGAAFTALFAACRAQTRGKGCFRAYFKAFKDNFLRATLLWVLFAALIYLCIGAAINLYQMDGSLAVFIMAVVGGSLLLTLLTMCLLFYSRFECTFRQLIKNGVVMVLSFPVRSLLIALLSWLPVLGFFAYPDYVAALGIVWVTLYHGTAGAVCVWFMKRPFARLAEKLLGVVESDVIDEPAHGH